MKASCVLYYFFLAWKINIKIRIILKIHPNIVNISNTFIFSNFADPSRKKTSIIFALIL